MINDNGELDQVKMVQQERHAFEKNYVDCGGRLNFLKWEQSADGAGSYIVDWEQLDNQGANGDESTDDLVELAEHITGCLFSWVECAKLKQIPKGMVLMPLQPTKEMIKAAVSEFEDSDTDDVEDKVVFAHQAMANVWQQSTIKS